MTSHQLHTPTRPTPASVALPERVVAKFYATMNGHRAIGPCIVEVVVVDYSSHYASIYFVRIDGEQTFSGFAHHLPSDPSTISAAWLINRVAIVDEIDDEPTQLDRLVEMYAEGVIDSEQYQAMHIAYRRSAEHITLDVTVGGVTRAVDFVLMPSGERAYAPGFAARIGRGSKLHRCEMAARRNADGTWTTRTSTTVLNRAALIVDFADRVPELMRSQHMHSQIGGAK